MYELYTLVHGKLEVVTATPEIMDVILMCSPYLFL